MSRTARRSSACWCVGGRSEARTRVSVSGRCFAFSFVRRATGSIFSILANIFVDLYIPANPRALNRAPITSPLVPSRCPWRAERPPKIAEGIPATRRSTPPLKKTYAVELRMPFPATTPTYSFIRTNRFCGSSLIVCLLVASPSKLNPHPLASRQAPVRAKPVPRIRLLTADPTAPRPIDKDDAAGKQEERVEDSASAGFGHFFAPVCFKRANTFAPCWSMVFTSLVEPPVPKFVFVQHVKEPISPDPRPENEDGLKRLEAFSFYKD